MACSMLGMLIFEAGDVGCGKHHLICFDVFFFDMFF